MRLVAIFIKEHFLFSEPQIINFGGKFIYNLSLVDGDQYEMTRTENSNFIENFWGKEISLVSAVVGENGSGKTNILRNLNNVFSPSLKQPIAFEAIYIFENLIDEKNYYFSENLKISNIENINKNDIETLYYSPVIDYDLVDINSPINMISYHKESLFLFYTQNIQRHLFFLKNSTLIENLKNSYSHFPYYEKLIITANQLYKDDFERVYIQTTLGNNYYRIRNNLMNLARESPFCFENAEHVETFFNGHKGIQEELKSIWSAYENTDEKSSHLIHDGRNFLKNLEINILSFLVIKDTFAITGDNKNYDFNKILDAENFVQKLDHFLNKFIIQTSNTIYNMLLETEIEIKVENSEKIINTLNNDGRLQTGSINQHEIKNLNIAIKKHVFLFKKIYEFYSQILNIKTKDYVEDIEGGIQIDIEKLEIEDFNKFLESYELLQIELKGLVPTKSENVLEIISNKKLSTGEKALLDLYSSIYDYFKKFRDHHYKENPIFLLDEADLGFHPEWKKKYINAIVRTLPLLMEYRRETIKNIQIIFATHDPLSLSDIPNNNVVYLKKENNKTVVLTEIERPKYSFGANITDLLADSFFIDDGLIGDFAKDKIDKTIKWINYQIVRKENESENRFELDENEFLYYKKIIQIIDEPILKMKLAQMFDELNSGDDFQKELAQKEIDYLRIKFDL